MQDLNDKAAGGSLSPAEWNQMPTELQNIIELFEVLDGADLDQLGKAIAAYAGAGTFYNETSSSTTAYVVAPFGSKQRPDSLTGAVFDGLIVRWRPDNANTGASTLDLDGIGAKDIKRENGDALVANDIVTSRDAIVRFDQATDDFFLQEYTRVESGALPRGNLVGLELVRTDANTITIQPGQTRGTGNSVNLELIATLAKDIDATWVAGAGGGMNATDHPASVNTWYHFFVIEDGAGTVDAGFDTSLTATNLLSDSGYVNFRRLGSVKTAVGTDDILEFTQVGDHFLWFTPVNSLPAEAQVTTARTATLATPLGVKCLAQIYAAHTGNIALHSTWIHSPDQDDSLAEDQTVGRGFVATPQGSGGASNTGDVRTGTSSDVRYVSRFAIAQTIGISTQGWYDRRGQDDY